MSLCLLKQSHFLTKSQLHSKNQNQENLNLWLNLEINKTLHPQCHLLYSLKNQIYKIYTKQLNRSSIYQISQVFLLLNKTKRISLASIISKLVFRLNLMRISQIKQLRQMSGILKARLWDNYLMEVEFYIWIIKLCLVALSN